MCLLFPFHLLNGHTVVLSMNNPSVDHRIGPSGIASCEDSVELSQFAFFFK